MFYLDEVVRCKILQTQLAVCGCRTEEAVQETDTIHWWNVLARGWQARYRRTDCCLPFDNATLSVRDLIGCSTGICPSFDIEGNQFVYRF